MATSDPYKVKLVRDEIPRLLGEDGTVSYGKVGSATRGRLLRAKLFEEAAEYAESRSEAELVDLFEVVRALARVEHGLTLDALTEKANTRRRERGGFDLGTCMLATHPTAAGEASDGNQ